MTKPWLFLDIDGVINPGGLAYPLEKELPANHFAIKVVHPTIGPMQIFVPDHMPSLLKELESEYDIVWATSWGLLARELEDHIGIKPVYCLEPKMRFKGPWLKGSAIEAFLMEKYEDDRRPWAWFDDEISDQAYDVGAVGRATEWLAINPNPKIGITRVHVATALAFAKGLKEAN